MSQRQPRKLFVPNSLIVQAEDDIYDDRDSLNITQASQNTAQSTNSRWQKPTQERGTKMITKQLLKNGAVKKTSDSQSNSQSNYLMGAFSSVVSQSSSIFGKSSKNQTTQGSTQQINQRQPPSEQSHSRQVVPRKAPARGAPIRESSERESPEVESRMNYYKLIFDGDILYRKIYNEFGGVFDVQFKVDDQTFGLNEYTLHFDKTEERWDDDGKILFIRMNISHSDDVRGKTYTAMMTRPRGRDVELNFFRDGSDDQLIISTVAKFEWFNRPSSYEEEEKTSPIERPRKRPSGKKQEEVEEAEEGHTTRRRISKKDSKKDSEKDKKVLSSLIRELSNATICPFCAESFTLDRDGDRAPLILTCSGSSHMLCQHCWDNIDNHSNCPFERNPMYGKKEHTTVPFLRNILEAATALIDTLQKDLK